MYSPVVSTQDSSVLVVSCDMGGLYLSEDAGASWRMLDQRNIRTIAFPPSGSWRLWAPRPATFAPDSSDLLTAAGPGRPLTTYRRSTDTWTPLPLAPPLGRETCTSVLMDALPTGQQDGDDARPAYIGTTGGAYLRQPGGATQRLQYTNQGVVADIPGPVVSILHPQGGVATPVLLVTPTLVLADTPGGTFVEAMTGIPPLGHGVEISDAVAAADAQGYRAFVAITATDPAAQSAPGAGVYTTDDATGTGWTSANSNLPNPEQTPAPGAPAPRCERLAAAPGDPRQIFCSLVYPDPKGRYYRIYRSLDEGVQWGHVLNVSPDTGRNPDNNVLNLAQAGGWVDIPPFNPDFGGAILGLSAAGSPAVVVASNQAGLYVSTDSAASWQQRYTAPSGVSSNLSCTGLDVTSSWNYLIHPRPPAGQLLHHISYTDIAYARSIDGGHTWNSIRLATRVPNVYYNTVYELAAAADASCPGMMWAAVAQQHDLPYDAVTAAGGDVLASTDYGASWTSISNNLPITQPVVSVALDPVVPTNAPQTHRQLWCAVYGDGVWQTTDSGTTWQKCPTQPPGVNPYRLQVHTDSTLFCSIAGNNKDGALAYSADGGATWTTEPLGLSHPSGDTPSHNVTDYGIHPTNSAVQFLCTRGFWDGSTRHPGGVWKTIDHGTTWTNVTALNNTTDGGSLPPYDPDFVSGFSAAFDPLSTDTVVVTTASTGGGGHGAWWSPTAGSPASATTIYDWQPIATPFLNTTRASYDADTVFITTFGGGVWSASRPKAPPSSTLTKLVRGTRIRTNMAVGALGTVLKATGDRLQLWAERRN